MLLILFFVAFIGLGSFLYSKIGLTTSLFCFYIFFMTLVPFHVKILSVTPPIIISHLLFVLSIFYLCKSKYKYEETTIALFKIYAYYIIVYVCLLPMSSSMTLASQITDIKITIFECQLPIAFIFLVNSIKDVRSIFICVLFVSFIMSIYGLLCVCIGSNPYYLLTCILYGAPDEATPFFEDSRGGLSGRFGSIIGHPLYYSVFVLIMFFLNLFAYLFMKRNKYIKYLYWVLFPLLLANLFFTGSRSSLVAVLIGIIYLLYKYVGLKNFIIYGALLYILSVFLVSVNAFGVYQPMIESTIFFWDENVASDAEINGSSISMRIDQFNAVFSEIKGISLFFGNGAGWPWWYTSVKGSHPLLLGFESIFFSGLTEFGIFGFVLLYVVFFFLLYFYVSKILRPILKKSNYCVIVAFLLSYIVVCIMTSPYFLTLFLGYFALILKASKIIHTYDKKMLLLKLMKNK